MSIPEPLGTGPDRIGLDGQTFYRVGDVLRAAGIARNTLMRWLRDGRVPETALRDRNGWRLFTRQELDAVREEANRIESNVPPG